MNQEIQQLKAKADSMAYLIRQIEICQGEIKQCRQMKINMVEANRHIPMFTRKDFDDIDSDIQDWNRGKLQYENQLKSL